MLSNAAVPVPPDPPSDWSQVVRTNTFTNLQRLGLWTGGVNPVPSYKSPRQHFGDVSARSLGTGAKPPAIYVVVHGWAPGYLDVVSQATPKGHLLWWDDAAHVDHLWASNWAWVSVQTPNYKVSGTGLLQQIMSADPMATALAYSWIDDSATDETHWEQLQYVYESEAHTQMNGIRLANALQQAIVPSFFQNGGRLHLIGHSHGSRVCTVAGMTLQKAGVPVAQLTILDSPETNTPLKANGANLLPFYLDQMQVQPAPKGAFIENYPSYFGVAYETSSGRASPVDQVVQVSLDPKPIYGRFDVPDSHTYAAAWYSGAAAGAKVSGQLPLGLPWPPVPADYQPPLHQDWPQNVPAPGNQWHLKAGVPKDRTYVYSFYDLEVEKLQTWGKVTTYAPDTIAFAPNAGDFSIYKGSFYAENTDEYGISFDLSWPFPQKGDYFVVAIEGDLTYTLLVLDGQSMPGGVTTIAINCAIYDITGNADLWLYYYGDPETRSDILQVRNFQYIQVSDASSQVPDVAKETEIAGTGPTLM